MAFETNDPVAELRAKAREMFPHNEELAKSTYHWHAADEIERLMNLNAELILAKTESR